MESTSLGVKPASLVLDLMTEIWRRRPETGTSFRCV